MSNRDREVVGTVEDLSGSTGGRGKQLQLTSALAYAIRRMLGLSSSQTLGQALALASLPASGFCLVISVLTISGDLMLRAPAVGGPMWTHGLGPFVTDAPVACLPWLLAIPAVALRSRRLLRATGIVGLSGSLVADLIPRISSVERPPAFILAPLFVASVVVALIPTDSEMREVRIFVIPTSVFAVSFAYVGCCYRQTLLGHELLAFYRGGNPWAQLAPAAPSVIVAIAIWALLAKRGERAWPLACSILIGLVTLMAIGIDRPLVNQGVLAPLLWTVLGSTAACGVAGLLAQRDRNRKPSLLSG